MILDANTNARIALRLSLAAYDIMQIDEAETAAAAIALAEESRYDWIFAGLVEGAPRAQVLGRRLARLPGAESTRRALMVPASRIDLAAGYTRHGFGAMLLKPIRQSQLNGCLMDSAPSVPAEAAAVGNDPP